MIKNYDYNFIEFLILKISLFLKRLGYDTISKACTYVLSSK